MAKPTNVFDRFNSGPNIGGWVAEDVLNKIINTSPTKTPILSAAGRGTAENTYHEWMRDDYAAANKDNAALDGDDATRIALSPPDRVANYAQIFTKAYGVTGRMQAVKKLGGVSNALSYFRAQKTIELKRDIEAAIISNNPAVAGSGSVAPKMGGLGVLIYTNAQHGAGGSTTAHTSGAPTTAPVAGTPRAFTKALLDDAVEDAYKASGDIPDAVYVSPAHKRVFSTFTGIAGNRESVNKGKQARIVGGADVYMSDFGEMTIVPHYLMEGGSTVYGLDLENVKVDFLPGRRFDAFDLARTGDSVSQEILADLTLVTPAENVHWKIADLTATGLAP